MEVLEEGIALILLRALYAASYFLRGSFKGRNTLCTRIFEPDLRYRCSAWIYIIEGYSHSDVRPHSKTGKNPCARGLIFEK